MGKGVCCCCVVVTSWFSARWLSMGASLFLVIFFRGSRTTVRLAKTAIDRRYMAGGWLARCLAKRARLWQVFAVVASLSCVLSRLIRERSRPRRDLTKSRRYSTSLHPTRSPHSTHGSTPVQLCTTLKAGCLNVM